MVDVMSSLVWVLFGVGGLALAVALGVVLYKEKPAADGLDPELLQPDKV